jgi:hypothetical protein
MSRYLLESGHALWRSCEPSRQDQSRRQSGELSSPDTGDSRPQGGEVAGVHRIPVMRVHLPALDHDVMDPVPALYTIRINGHLGAMLLSAFPAMMPERHGAETVLTGLLDRSALYGVLADIDALGLDLLEVRLLEPGRESPEPGDGLSP